MTTTNESFLDRAQRHLDRSRKFYTPIVDLNRLPTLAPANIRSLIPASLRKELEALFRATLALYADLEDLQGHNAVERERKLQRDAILRDPRKAPVPGDSLQISGQLLKRRLALIDRHSEDFGAKFFQCHEQMYGLVIPALQEEANQKLERHCAESRDLGFQPDELPLDLSTVWLLRLFIHACNGEAGLRATRQAWQQRGNYGFRGVLGVDNRLLEILGIPRPEVKKASAPVPP